MASILQKMQAQAQPLPQKSVSAIETENDRLFAEEIVSNPSALNGIMIPKSAFDADGVSREALNKILLPHSLEFRAKTKTGKGKNATKLSETHFYLRKIEAA